MKILRFSTFFLILALIACSSDDDRDKPEPPRDEAEVYQENLQEIEEYLETHFYYLEDSDEGISYQRIAFDTIAGDNANKTPLIADESLKSKTVSTSNVDYKLYYLEIQKGNEEKYQPTFADKVAITYRASNLKNEKFTENANPEVMDMPITSHFLFSKGQLKGTIAGITEFKGASSFEENSDGTVTYSDDYGLGAVFIPSGLGFFQNPPFSTNVGQYKPFIFSFQLYDAVQMDHDDDGIPSFMEDLEGNENLYQTDTDKDGTPNFLDGDDDGDNVPTRDEIIIHETDKDWLTPDDLEFPDTDNSGTPDYLDPNI